MSATGRVLQVNVSPGGLPKLPVDQAWVSRLGLDGDGHNARTVHGGPHRAVCLFGIEAIERLQAEGHPVGAGGVGENLTTTGIEWSLLPAGTRARIGDELLLEISDTASPCATQRQNFSDGRFSRISIEIHPSDARMYARVIREGPVRPNDPIELLPMPADSRALDELKLDALDWVSGKSALLVWRLLEELGLDIRIFDDGELLMAAVPGEERPDLSHAYGLARLPNLVHEAQQFYDDHRSKGCLITDGAPWPDAVPRPMTDAFAADPADVTGDWPAGLRIDRLTASDAGDWVAVRSAAERRPDDYWTEEFVRALIGAPHATLLKASLDDVPVGVAWMYGGHKTAWLRGGAVVPEHRNKGIHRALIGERARLAAEAGCNLIGVWAETGSTSARNLASAGFQRIGTREHHAYVPASVAEAVG
jgi:MOSC domain-containing protein YiiM/GNAT superfamily N-acetyltransferase